MDSKQKIDDVIYRGLRAFVDALCSKALASPGLLDKTFSILVTKDEHKIAITTTHLEGCDSRTLTLDLKDFA